MTEVLERLKALRCIVLPTVETGDTNAIVQLSHKGFFVLAEPEGPESNYDYVLRVFYRPEQAEELLDIAHEGWNPWISGNSPEEAIRKWASDETSLQDGIRELIVAARPEMFVRTGR